MGSTSVHRPGVRWRAAVAGAARWLARPHSIRVEVASILVLYVLYEAGRGLVAGSVGIALRHADEIADLERQAHVFWEASVQRAVLHLPALVGFLNVAYMSLHLGATALLLAWLYWRHRRFFPLARNALIAATAIALVVHVAFPTAPPRMAFDDISDTVTSQMHVNLSSHLLGVFYNPIAAVPSMHFGYAVLVGALVFLLARPWPARALGAAYPLVVLVVIVATGNHFLFDALAGAAVMGLGILVALAVVRGARLAREQRRSEALDRRRAAIQL